MLVQIQPPRPNLNFTIKSPRSNLPDMTKWTKEYRKEYDKKYSASRRKEKYAKQRQRIAEIKAWFAEYKASLKCSRCTENHPACLQFHHLGDKKDNVSNMVGQGHGKEDILKEVSKCIVLCANCHAKKHFEE